ncbi:MAG: DUF3858 domain-containing protein, partial [Candidatus Omnitrophica bacterium]|nr:DUF3858 domain-containing protein [Candidatus Omnitrophota bacterium]
PMQFSFLDTKENEVTIAIPDGFTVEYMPSGIQEESPWYSFALRYTQEDGRIRLRQKTRLKKRAVTVEEYPAFKAFCEGIAKRIKESIVLKEKDE